MNIEEMIMLYKNGFSYQKIAEIENRSKGFIMKMMKQNGNISRTNLEKGRLYYHNTNFFKDISTEEQAYWLGFLLADGYILSSRPIEKGSGGVGCAIDKKDLSHLEKLKKSLNATNKISIYKGCCRIIFRCEEIKSDLESLGFTSNKSYDAKPPKIKEDLNRHLIRGIVDGDGSVSILNKTKYGNKYYVSITGTREVCSFIETWSGLNWRWYQRYPERANNNYTISISQQDNVLIFLYQIYEKTNFYLDRKYNNYLIHKTSVSNTRKRGV
jgi:hypothetical protein